MKKRERNDHILPKRANELREKSRSGKQQVTVTARKKRHGKEDGKRRTAEAKELERGNGPRRPKGRQGNGRR